MTDTPATTPRDAASEPETDRELPPEEEVFEMLSNRRRRHVIDVLRAEGGRVDLSTVARRVAARERGVDPGELGYDDRKSVHVSVYQHHGPKMDDAGLVEYDRRAGELALTDVGAAIDVDLGLDGAVDGDDGRPAGGDAGRVPDGDPAADRKDPADGGTGGAGRSPWWTVAAATTAVAGVTVVAGVLGAIPLPVSDAGWLAVGTVLFGTVAVGLLVGGPVRAA